MAEQSDVVVMCLGLDATIEGEDVYKRQELGTVHGKNGSKKEIMNPGHHADTDF